MTLVKELHNSQGAIIGYKRLNLGSHRLLDLDLINIFNWVWDAGAVDIYMDYQDDMNILFVLESYLRYHEIQTSTNIGKRAPE